MILEWDPHTHHNSALDLATSHGGAHESIAASVDSHREGLARQSSLINFNAAGVHLQNKILSASGHNNANKVHGLKNPIDIHL